VQFLQPILTAVHGGDQNHAVLPWGWLPISMTTCRSYSELRSQHRDESYGVTVTVMMFDFTMPSAGLAQFIGQKT